MTSIHGRMTRMLNCLLAIVLAFALSFSMGVFVSTASAHAAQGQDDAIEAVSEWDVSVAQDKSVMASLRAVDDGDGYELSIRGYGPMKDFARASDVPWWDSAAQKITRASVGEGVTNIGSYALALSTLTTVRIASTVSVIGDHAFDGATALVALDASACAIKSVGTAAFDVADASHAAKRTLYVGRAEDAQLIGASLSPKAAICTAVAVTNDGTFAQNVEFAAGSLAQPSLDDKIFVSWTSDPELMHPITAWQPYATGAVYARFAERSQETDEGQPYPGYQGLDQAVQVLDTGALPAHVVKNADVLFYGQHVNNSYDNRFQTAFNGYEDQVFAFSLSRGFNANGGDGSYQVSFTMPYISVLDEAGNTVASYDNGNGKLKLVSMVIDGVDGASSGYTINAFRIGLEAGTLGAGTYTLRFGRGLGANNGTSFLGADVDFRFDVEYPEQYQLTFDTASGDAVVSGIAFAEGVSGGVDVEIPAQHEGKTVTGIADGAFAGQSLVRSVSVPASVRSIGSHAFADMLHLETVSMAGRADNVPIWGTEVFTGSADLVLEGYSTAATVKDAAESYDNVTFQPLEDGVYVNHQAVANGRPVALSAQQPKANVLVVTDGKVNTADYRGFISNTNVVFHEATTTSRWNELTARANGECNLVIRDEQGRDVATVPLLCTGFASDGSTAPSKLDRPQGNGSTISLLSVATDGKSTTVLTNSHDETLSYCDNTIPDGVSFKGAVITLNIGGPGSAWEATRWDWNDWTANHLNPHISLRDARGAVVATVGRGLTWVTLTNSSRVQLAIDDGVMTSGSTYTLVAGEQLTGHNVSAQLLREIRWTFKATKQDIAVCALSSIVDQDFAGKAVEPDPVVTRAIPAIQLWDEATESQYTKREASTLALKKDVDYVVTYADNDRPGTATVIVTGKGDYTGTLKANFKIVDPSAPSGPDEPGTPDTPDVPDNPDEPSGPDAPDDPDQPSNPDTPSGQGPIDTGQVMYRLYNPNSGEHFYTASTIERDAVIAAGWNDEGIGWTAPSDGIQVYRLYNSYAGEHHYTTSEVERDALVAAGWTWEEGGWFSDSSESVPLYRAYNPNAYANNHNYTTSEVEHQYLLSLGWQDEGIGWYGIG